MENKYRSIAPMESRIPEPNPKSFWRFRDVWRFDRWRTMLPTRFICIEPHRAFVRYLKYNSSVGTITSFQITQLLYTIETISSNHRSYHIQSSREPEKTSHCCSSQNDEQLDHVFHDWVGHTSVADWEADISRLFSGILCARLADNSRVQCASLFLFLSARAKSSHPEI